MVSGGASAARGVNLALYRAMWRWTLSKNVRYSRFELPLESLPIEVASLARGQPPRDQRSCQELVRAAWRDGRAQPPGAPTSDAVDRAFRCLRVMHEFQAEIEERVSRRIANSDRTGIRYQLGEVLRHSKFGYRGVVVGWDRRPQHDVDAWEAVQKTPSKGEQPFYRIIPDVSDCQALFDGPRELKYVAQENLEKVPLAHRRVHHPGLIGSLFERYEPTLGR